MLIRVASMIGHEEANVHVINICGCHVMDMDMDIKTMFILNINNFFNKNILCVSKFVSIYKSGNMCTYLRLLLVLSYVRCFLVHLFFLMNYEFTWVSSNVRLPCGIMEKNKHVSKL